MCVASPYNMPASSVESWRWVLHLHSVRSTMHSWSSPVLFLLWVYGIEDRVHYKDSMIFSCNTIQYPFSLKLKWYVIQCFWDDVKPFQAIGVQRTSMKNNDNVTKQCIFFLSMLFGYKYSNSEGLLQSSAMLLAPSGKSFLNLVKENKRRTKGEQNMHFIAFQCFPQHCRLPQGGTFAYFWFPPISDISVLGHGWAPVTSMYPLATSSTSNPTASPHPSIGSIHITPQPSHKVCTP